MRIALIADVHANLHALEAVLHDTQAHDAEQLVCLGDIVGYGAQPRECAELLRRLGCLCLMGNHDQYTTSHAFDPVLRNRDIENNPVWAGVKHARAQLAPEDLAWLENLPTLSTVEGGVIAHASLHDFDQWPYLRTAADAEPTLKMLGGQVGFFGHTHRQRIFHLPATDPPPEKAPQVFQLPADTGYAITIGSVGQPRDPGPEAAWTLWDPDERLVSFHRVPYDCTAAAHAILAANLPSASALRLLT
ncbi:MAG: metallophosphoesterase family protein [Verrucomicrobia bacterium]|nr:metallophosphoesterase family protein [Verrucomicrobiota bacterium]